MGEKKRIKKGPQTEQPPVRLSFGMIVKNGEKTIGKALDSVKDITFEQIVVDTGSTDRTVEIAEKKGAKVCYFEWIDDFAAARNYSVEQVTGDWIVMLDADEYFGTEDAERLLDFLKQIQAEPEKWENCLAVSCIGVNLDDNGRRMTVARTVHVFRNSPAIRFKGRIHEQLTINADNIVHVDEITLYHTGYSASAHMETGKAQRNIALLRAELAKEPGNLTVKTYLANSLSICDDKESQSEAEKLYTEIMNNAASEHVPKTLKVKMYIFFINKYLNDPDGLAECEGMCRKALTAFPGALDFEYFLAVVFSRKGEHQAAWDLLKKCEAKLISANEADASILIPADPTALFGQMILTAKEMGDIENLVLYSTHLLTMDKTRLSVLSPCIATLLYYGVSGEEVIELLSNIYDFANPDDVLLVADAAKACGAVDFAEKVMQFTNDK